MVMRELRLFCMQKNGTNTHELFSFYRIAIFYSIFILNIFDFQIIHIFILLNPLKNTYQVYRMEQV